MSSPAALAGEDKCVSRNVVEEVGMNREDVDASDQDSSKTEKVGKLNLLAGAVGVAGVAAGLGEFAITSKDVVVDVPGCNHSGKDCIPKVASKNRRGCESV